MQKCSLHHGVTHVQVVFKVSSVSLIDRRVNWRRLSRAMGTDASMSGTGRASSGARCISCVFLCKCVTLLLWKELEQWDILFK